MLAALRVGEPSGLALLDDLSVALRATVSSHLWPAIGVPTRNAAGHFSHFSESEPLISLLLSLLFSLFFMPPMDTSL